MDGIECSEFVFYNDFDSANLAKVEYVTAENACVKGTKDQPDAEFNIWTKPDCVGTEFENGNRTWFYFGMKANRPGLTVRFNLVDLNRQGKMYSQGMAPVYRVVPGKMQWERVRDKPSYSLNNDIFTLSFKFKTPENTQSMMYFAFTYPFSYNDLERMLNSMESKLLRPIPPGEDDIYYVREPLCRSLDGRTVDCITITSYHGITHEREDHLNHLFPSPSVPRPYKFMNKKVVFISARVHPGETPSSFVFNGILQNLLSREDPIGIALRRLYVFKLIPFLNPDGVARGHYRTDTRGVNLNRVYMNPSFEHHPSVYAARALIRYYHFGFEKEDQFIDLCESCLGNGEEKGEGVCRKVSDMSLEEDGSKDFNKCQRNCKKCNCLIDPVLEDASLEDVGATGDVNSNSSGLFLYVDLHGHASKKGIFMYGNHFKDPERSVECMLLPKLMSINNHNFHFNSCNFTERNMYLKDKRDGMSRAGSGRVSVLSLTGIIKSYTLECNYNTGRIVNVVPPTVKEQGMKVMGPCVPPKFTPQIFEEVGRSLCASILDLTGSNPNSRLPNSEFRSLSGLKDWLMVNCISNEFKGKKRSSFQGKGKVLLKTRAPVVKKALGKGKERALGTVQNPQPSCSYSSKSSLRGSKFGLKGKMVLKGKNGILGEKVKAVRSKSKVSLKKKDEEKEVQLREICFIKNNEGKTVIAKYKSNKEDVDDNLVVSWDAHSKNAHIYTQRNRVNSAPNFVGMSMRSTIDGAGTSKGAFRVHNFAKHPIFSKGKKKLRKMASASDSLNKGDKKKKKLKPK